MDNREVLGKLVAIQDSINGLVKELTLPQPVAPPAPAAPKKLGNVTARVGDALYVDELCPACIGYYDMPMDTPTKMRMASKEAGEQFAFLNLETNAPVPFPFNRGQRVWLIFQGDTVTTPVHRVSNTQLRVINRCEAIINQATKGVICRIYVENIN